MTIPETMIGLSRFGMGGRAGDPPPHAIRTWLRDQLKKPDTASFDGLPSTAEALTAFTLDRMEMKGPPENKQHRSRDIYQRDVTAQVNQAIDGSSPLRERLVLFWSNHFTVSVKAHHIFPLAGCFVREAIRPYVTGKFEDMALAVLRHPAMLLYLNNAQSVGPDSAAGKRTNRGLNENLARETLELHTLGADSGYSQTDVTEFAKILTGWSVDMNDPVPGFKFRARAHQPGSKRLMGESFPEGELGGLAAIQFLATHPATYAHLARQLARHFVADNPPAAICHRVEAALAATGGDLGAATAALLDLPQLWPSHGQQAPAQTLGKIRSPLDYVIASIRALGVPPDRRPDFPHVLHALGQPMWGAPAPNGWPDDAASWGAPESLLLRIDWAYRLSGLAQDGDGEAIARAAGGGYCAPDTLEAMRRASSRRQAVTLALASPEFLRR